MDVIDILQKNVFEDFVFYLSISWLYMQPLQKTGVITVFDRRNTMLCNNFFTNVN